MSKKSIALRSRGFIEPGKDQDKNTRHRLGAILPIPVILLITLWSKPTGASLWRGSILLAIGEFIRLWSAGYAGQWREAMEEGRKVTGGPFALVRNPCYVGSFIIGIGLVVMSGRWAAFILLFISALLAMLYLVPQEERALEKQFGASYGDYRSSTPGYIPGLKQIWPWYKARRKPYGSADVFENREALQVERHMLIFLGSILVAMLVRWQF